MKTSPFLRFCALRPAHRLGSALCFSVLVFSASSSLFAQTPPAADDPRRRYGSSGTPGDPSADRRNLTPQDMQARMLASMRDRFEVADDEEWKVISDRLSALMELRRNSSNASMFGSRGPQGGSDPSGRGSSRTSTTRPSGGTELAALQAAVKDKLPDAEIKSRLERLRDARKENEIKLAKAQEDLRAVLSVRQEALAVVFGLLP